MRSCATGSSAARGPPQALRLLRSRRERPRGSRAANGVKFGRKPKLSPYQRAEAIKRRAAGETLASIARSYAVDLSMISRL
jgi:hypothetical protein